MPRFALMLAVCLSFGGCQGGATSDGSAPSRSRQPATPATPPATARAPLAAAVAAVKPADAAARREAKAIFAQRCTLCHGLQGRGNGPASATLSPKPRDYTDPAWQKGIDDADIRLVIVEGGPALHKSLMMPPNPDLKDKPQVVEGLVEIIRGLKPAGSKPD